MGPVKMKREEISQSIILSINQSINQLTNWSCKGENWLESPSWPFQSFLDHLLADIFALKWETRHGSATAIRLVHRLNTDCSYTSKYFPQQVPLCTTGVHDQSADICIKGYLRILWIQNTKSSNLQNKFMFHVKNWSI